MYRNFMISQLEWICFSFLDIDECAEADRGGCEHTCSNYEGGYYCTCNVGYRLKDDDKSCEGTFGDLINAVDERPHSEVLQKWSHGRWSSWRVIQNTVCSVK